MGWVIFEKIYEDEYYVVYKYSHDSKEMDGIIKIKKVRYYDIDTSIVFNKFSDEEKWEVLRRGLEEEGEEPNVNKELWAEYQQIRNESTKRYGEWLENCVEEVKFSKTDWRSGHFANQVILYLAKICANEEWVFPESHMLAYG